MSQYVYTLTSLTGRKRNVGRTVIINGFEFGRRALLVGGIAIAAAFFPTIILGAIFGPLLFILTPGIFIATAFILFESRTRDGLQVRLYQSILDKKKSNSSEFYICFRPVGESLGRANLVRSSAAVAVDTEPERGSTAIGAPVFTNPNKKGLRANSIASLLEGKS